MESLSISKKLHCFVESDCVVTQTLLETYKTLATQFYECEKTAQDASIEISFYADYAAVARGPILEPMCGSGRIMLPLLARGYDIEGFDASEAMLTVLREKYAMIFEAPAPVWQEYMQDFSPHKKYKLIIIPFGSFGLVLDSDNALKSLRALRNALFPGGMLLVEIDTVHSVLSSHLGSSVRCVGAGDGSQLRLSARISYDQSTKRYQSLCVYERIECNVVTGTEQECFEQYIYTDEEFCLLLRVAGFTHITAYASYSKDIACSVSAPHIIYECVSE